MLKYIYGALGVIVVIFLIVVLFFRAGDDSKKSTSKSPTVMQLVDYADKNSNVSQTTVGKMVGEQERRSVRITVTPNERRIEILGGYEETPESIQSFPNTQDAYVNFLSALSRLGFTKERKNTADPRGVCPTGNRYVYDLSLNGNHVSNLWQVSCDDSGTFAGKGSTTRELFQRQIPGYDKLVEKIQL